MKKGIKAVLTSLLALMLGASLLGSLPTQAFAEAASQQYSPDPGAGQDVKPEEVPAFRLVVRTPYDYATFRLPTSSNLLGSDYVGKEFNWTVSWGDGSVVAYQGISSPDEGFAHTYTTAGDYEITITPNGSTEAWLAAFGFSYGRYGVNLPSNRAMVIGAYGPIRPEMTRTSAQIDGSQAPPDNEWAYCFMGCGNLAIAPPIEGWEGITAVGDRFMDSLFTDCTSLATLPGGFLLPPDLTSVGICFMNNCFNGCSSLVNLPAGLTLPVGITTAGSWFADSMFCDCASLGALPDGFSFPLYLTEAPDMFGTLMFSGCTSLTTLPDSFTFPRQMTVAGNYFAREMFDNCTGLLSLPDGFQLPAGLVTVGDNFVSGMFRNCTSLTGLPEGFTLPPTIRNVGPWFAAEMFKNCSSLGALPSSFRLPETIVSADVSFCEELFYMAGSPTFQINQGFQLPSSFPNGFLGIYFNRSFQLSAAAPSQNRTAASIIGSCPTPWSDAASFDAHFKDIAFIAVNWGGGGLIPMYGPPGSGDLDGDGFVTMVDVLTCAQAAMGDIGLNFGQLAAIDMDGDNCITMADVLMVYKAAL